MCLMTMLALREVVECDCKVSDNMETSFRISIRAKSFQKFICAILLAGPDNILCLLNSAYKYALQTAMLPNAGLKCVQFQCFPTSESYAVLEFCLILLH
jgi:hypothetical protein